MLCYLVFSVVVLCCVVFGVVCCAVFCVMLCDVEGSFLEVNLATWGVILATWGVILATGGVILATWRVIFGVLEASWGLLDLLGDFRASKARGTPSFGRVLQPKREPR